MVEDGDVVGRRAAGVRVVVAVGAVVGVRAVQVSAEQAAFVGNTAFNLLDAQSDPASEPMAILANGRVIGFYRLDFAPRSVVGRDLGTPHAGIRAFCLDRAQQGHGYGMRAAIAMANDLARRHRDRRMLVLAVHCCNRPKALESGRMNSPIRSSSSCASMKDSTGWKKRRR